MTGRVIVLGGAGRLGRAAAQAFRSAGWQVASLVRSRSVTRAAPGSEVIEVDARDRDAVVEAAGRADLVLYALNPPYTEWGRLARPLAETAIAVAQAAGATLLFPGNLYNYGPGMPAVVDETTPMHPTSRKGALRVAIEARLREMAASGTQVVIVRAGDFYGGSGAGSWFDRVIVKDVRRGHLSYPGPLDVVHEWAYLPDLAEAMVRLAAVRADLGPFEEFGFAGHAVTGRELAAAISRALRHDMQVGAMPWWMLRLASPVVPIFRELTEIAYLWRVPHRIDGAKLAAAIGPLPHTPFRQSVAAALQDLGLRPARNPASA